MSDKIRILCWSDSAAASTGFGVVSKNILGYLHKTGKYHIDHLAINYPARFGKNSQVPWQEIPARVLDTNDPYGKVLFLRCAAEGNYDLIWVMNDTYVTYDIVGSLKEIFQKKREIGSKVPKLVYYYPVDCHLRKEVSAMVEFADCAVAYTDHGLGETLKTLPHLKSKIKKIGHGVDSKVYYPIDKDKRKILRNKYLGSNADKFVFLNVNRNSDRKQLSRTILAFSKFKEEVPNSILLLHTMPIDKNSNRSIDLFVCVQDLGLSLENDVLFPKHYEPSRSFPENTLNEIYNTADCFITNSLGEGYGLSTIEAMAAAIPIIAPNNTCFPQLLGQYSERGYMYECKDWLYIDNSGLRPFGSLPNILDKMHLVYRVGAKDNEGKLLKARQWAEENDWSIICPQWDNLFGDLLSGNLSSGLEENGVIDITNSIMGDVI